MLPTKDSHYVPAVETTSVPSKKKENICLILCQRFCVINSTPWNLPAAACAVLASADAFVLMVIVMTVLSPAFIVSDFRALGSGIYILPATL